jgi:carboxymethylenebutenolidase
MSHSQPQGYLAIPAAGEGPGLLVLHPWWGLNALMESVCDRLASEGFVAFAPDLYHGQVAATIEEAERLSRSLDEAQVEAQIADAVEFVSERASEDSSGLGVIGFSLGAYYALKLSADGPDRVRAVVVFYGTGYQDFRGSKAVYLGHFAETDPFEPESEVERLERNIRAAGCPATFYTYADTGHWFFEGDRPDAYNQVAAQLAWERTIRFLKEALSS